MSSQPHFPDSSILLIGASRGLGHAIAEEFLARGWRVVGTVRSSSGSPLHELADRYPERLEIEHVDTTDADQLAALRERLGTRRFEILFVNAGVASNDKAETTADVSTDEFVRLMVTNALAPMRTIDALEGLVTESGMIGVMSSGLASVANNDRGGNEVYRGTKAALNTFMRSYAARTPDERRALLLLAPGWIRTALGGPDAPFSLEETIPDIVNVMVAQQGQPGLRYLDRFGKSVAW